MVQPTDTKRKCIACEEIKAQDRLYKKQWKLQDQDMCKPCWDGRNANTNNASKINANVKDEGPRKKQVLERECIVRAMPSSGQKIPGMGKSVRSATDAQIRLRSKTRRFIASDAKTKNNSTT
jgi:hypothetical protein